MSGLKLLILAPIYGFAIVVTALIGLTFGPDIEETLFPVITDQSVIERWRTADLACFRWRYHKARNVTLMRVAYVVEREDGVRFPTDELRPDLGIPSNDTTTAKVGTTRIIPKCVTIPSAMRDAVRMTIKGRQMYRPFHRLWLLDQPVMDGAGILIDTPARADALPSDATASP